MRTTSVRVAALAILLVGTAARPAVAQYKPEFALSLVITQETAWVARR